MYLGCICDESPRYSVFTSVISCYIPFEATSPFYFFFNDTATTEIYTLSLHDALPICFWLVTSSPEQDHRCPSFGAKDGRSEEHTSELQSQSNLVCRLLLEKKKNIPRIVSPCRSEIH